MALFLKAFLVSAVFLIAVFLLLFIIAWALDEEHYTLATIFTIIFGSFMFASVYMLMIHLLHVVVSQLN